MYKELNKVFSMIKTELKSEKVELEKVELNVVKDIQKMVGILKKGLSDMEKKGFKQSDALKSLFKAQDAVEQANKDALNSSAVGNFGKASSILDNAEKQAKELGVAFRDIKGFTDLTSLMGKVEKMDETIEEKVKRSKRFLK